MTGLDTNILIRHLAQDDPIQSPKATQLIERRLTPGRPGFISLVTLTEVVWTLATKYSVSRLDMARILEGLLGASNLVIQNEQEVAAAMTALYDGADFADVLIGALGQWAGCTSTLTFDHKAARLPGFELL